MEHERRHLTLVHVFSHAHASWHGVKLGKPDWSEHSHSVALSAELRQERLQVHLILNAYWEPLDFELPLVGNGRKILWRRWVDTALDSPCDIVPWQTSPAISGSTYHAESRSVVLLFADVAEGNNRERG
jgi:glycogen operon protein